MHLHLVSLPVTASNDFERYEGMLITFPQALVISEYFNYDRYGEIVLPRGVPFNRNLRRCTPTSGLIQRIQPVWDLLRQANDSLPHHTG